MILAGDIGATKTRLALFRGDGKRFKHCKAESLSSQIAEQGGERSALATKLCGELAIASAKIAYEIYLEIIGGNRWRRLADKKAHPQWLFWASTGTKNPDYSDVKYVDHLIGPDTIRCR